jgi:hypothetical protein
VQYHTPCTLAQHRPFKSFPFPGPIVPLPSSLSHFLPVVNMFGVMETKLEEGRRVTTWYEMFLRPYSAGRAASQHRRLLLIIKFLVIFVSAELRGIIACTTRVRTFKLRRRNASFRNMIMCAPVRSLVLHSPRPILTPLFSVIMTLKGASEMEWDYFPSHDSRFLPSDASFSAVLTASDISTRSVPLGFLQGKGVCGGNAL